MGHNEDRFIHILCKTALIVLEVVTNDVLYGLRVYTNKTCSSKQINNGLN